MVKRKKIIREAKPVATDDAEKRSKGWVASVQQLLTGAEYAEPPDLDFETCERYYNTVPDVFAAINQIANMAAGAGYHFQNGSDEARKAATEFAEQIGLGRKMLIMSREMLLYGNSFWERLSDGNIKWLPPRTMEKSVAREKSGRVVGYAQRIGREIVKPRNISVDGKPVKVTFTADEIIHVKWNVISNAGYGSSVIAPSRSLIDLKKNVQKDMKDILARYSSPHTIYILANADYKTHGQIEKYLNELDPGKDVLLSTKGITKVTAQQITIDPRARFNEYLQHIDDNIVVGLLDPLLIFGRSGARISDASATAMLEAFDRQIRTLQHELSIPVETQIIYPQLGNLKPEDCPQLVFGAISKPSYTFRELGLTIQSILRAGPDPSTGHFLLAPNQIEFILRKAGLELPAAEWPEEPPPEPGLIQKAKQAITGGGKSAVQ